jgi:hypothetical protein
MRFPLPQPLFLSQNFHRNMRDKKFTATTEGFTFIETLIYSALLSVVFLDTTTVWLATARSTSFFMTSAQAQESRLFAAESIDALILNTASYSNTRSGIANQQWHSISQPTTTYESSSTIQNFGAISKAQTIEHLSITIPSLKASTSAWQLDYYVRH